MVRRDHCSVRSSRHRRVAPKGSRSRSPVSDLLPGRARQPIEMCQRHKYEGCPDQQPKSVGWLSRCASITQAIAPGGRSRYSPAVPRARRDQRRTGRRLHVARPHGRIWWCTPRPGDITVEPAATPGGLACLYPAWCAGCGAVYPGPFRVPPRASTGLACRAVQGATTSPRWSNRVHPTEMRTTARPAAMGGRDEAPCPTTRGVRPGWVLPARSGVRGCRWPGGDGGSSPGRCGGWRGGR